MLLPVLRQITAALLPLSVNATSGCTRAVAPPVATVVVDLMLPAPVIWRMMMSFAGPVQTG